MLTSHFPPSWGGTESQNLDVATFFVERGHNVEILDVGLKTVSTLWKKRMVKKGIHVTYLMNPQRLAWDHLSLIKQFSTPTLAITFLYSGEK